MKPIFLILICLIAVTPIFSQDWDPLALGRQSYYSFDDPATVRAVLQADYEQGLLDGADPLLLESGLELMLGMVALREEEEELAEEHFTRAYALSTEKLAVEESLRAYRLTAASGFSLSAVKGVAAIISMTDELDGYIDRILELDPQDPLGLMMKAQRLTFAPRIFGGDPELAVSLLQQNIVNWDRLTDHLKYETLSTLSFAWEKLKDDEKARSYAESALEIFPRNEEMQERLEDLS